MEHTLDDVFRRLSGDVEGESAESKHEIAIKRKKSEIELELYVIVSGRHSAITN